MTDGGVHFEKNSVNESLLCVLANSTDCDTLHDYVRMCVFVCVSQLVWWLWPRVVKRPVIGQTHTHSMSMVYTISGRKGIVLSPISWLTYTWGIDTMTSIHLFFERHSGMIRRNLLSILFNGIDHGFQVDRIVYLLK